MSLTNYRFRHNIACIISNPQWHSLNRPQQKKSQRHAANNLYFQLTETRYWSSVVMKVGNTLNVNFSTRTLSTSHPLRVNAQEGGEQRGLGCANLQSDTLFEFSFFSFYAPRQCKWQLRQSSHSLHEGPLSFISGQCSQTGHSGKTWRWQWQRGWDPEKERKTARFCGSTNPNCQGACRNATP